MIFSEIPNSGVKKKRPSDSPNGHAINAERFNIINALVEKPHHENHGCQSAKVDQKPERFFAATAGKKHYADSEKHCESGDAEKGIWKTKNMTLPSACHRSAAYKWIYVAGKVYIGIFDELNGIYGQHKRSQKAYNTADY